MNENHRKEKGGMEHTCRQKKKKDERWRKEEKENTTWKEKKKQLIACVYIYVYICKHRQHIQ
jgi:hypothetical protein